MTVWTAWTDVLESPVRTASTVCPERKESEDLPDLMVLTELTAKREKLSVGTRDQPDTRA